jgi:hypothetical protein
MQHLLTYLKNQPLLHNQSKWPTSFHGQTSANKSSIDPLLSQQVLMSKPINNALKLKNTAG